MSCITHHNACDCREAHFAKSQLVYESVVNWLNKSDAQIRLQIGEATAQEIRTVRAILKNILEF